MIRTAKRFVYKLISNRDVSQKIEQIPPPCKGDGMGLTWRTHGDTKSSQVLLGSRRDKNEEHN